MIVHSSTMISIWLVHRSVQRTFFINDCAFIDNDQFIVHPSMCMWLVHRTFMEHSISSSYFLWFIVHSSSSSYSSSFIQSVHRTFIDTNQFIVQFIVHSISSSFIVHSIRHSISSSYIHRHWTVHRAIIGIHQCVSMCIWLFFIVLSNQFIVRSSVHRTFIDTDQFIVYLTGSSSTLISSSSYLHCFINNDRLVIDSDHTVMNCLGNHITKSYLT